MATEVLSNEEWLEAAHQALDLPKDSDLRLVEVKSKDKNVAAGEDMEGFLGETTPVKVRVASVASGEQREAALFLKVVPSNNRVREALAEGTHAFLKEADFFDLLARLSPRLPQGAIQPWGARCLLYQPRLLLFEDLSVQGFRTPGIRNTLDFARCAAALDAIARLHATSLALEETDRRARNINPWRLVDRFPEALKEIMFTDSFSNILSNYIVAGVKCIKALVSLMPQYKDSPRYKEILQKVEQFPKIAYEVVKPSKKYRNVICHGDIWVNNIMFRESAWGQVAEARLVDFQLTRYAPPALDVEMLLQLCTRRALRDAHAHELRATYYDALEKALAAAGFRARDLLPRAEFDASCHIGGAFARIAAVSYFPGDLLPTDILRPLMDSVDDLESYLVEDRSEYVRKAWERDAEYRERLGETISEFVDNLLLTDHGLL